MWCAQCQSDVATEVAADGQSLLCTACGGEVRKVFAPSLHPDVQRARDVLARLSKNNSGEAKANPAGTAARIETPEPAAAAPAAPSEPTPQKPTSALRPAAQAPSSELSNNDDDATTPEVAERLIPPRRQESPPAAEESRKTSPARQFRIDAAHPINERARSHVPQSSPTARAPDRPSPPEAQRVRRDDGAHASVPPPHFDVAASAKKRPPGRSESTWGQLMAYLGVAVLTVGTALVLWGYFGGPPAYAPTGWLVTTAGQMLLLLGVITLVSGGMQQTTHEVAARVAHLDGRMHRIESTAHELLHGPHFGRSRSAAFDRESAQHTGDVDD